MELDSSVYESSNLVDFPKVFTNSINTFKSNSLCYNSYLTNNNNLSNIYKRKSENKNKKQPKKNNKFTEDLKLLLAKKMAKNKLKYIDINNLNSIIINYKNNYNEDPINKYINNFTKYIPIIIKTENVPIDFIRNNKEFLNDINKINIKKKKIENKEEKYLNFKKDNLKFQNYYVSRMSNSENKNKIKTNEENIIIIQKNVRGFLFRLKLDKEISRIIVKYIIENIIKIQRAVRNLLKQKNYKTNFIIEVIKKERQAKGNIIIDLLYKYYYTNIYKKNTLIKKILDERAKSANKICKNIKYFLLRKKIKKIRELQRNNLEIIYPIDNNKKIKLKIYYNDNMHKEFYFEFCKIRKIYVLYINKDMIENNNNKNEYFAHFFIDDKCVIDKRYKIVKNKSGIIYNLVVFKNIEKIKNKFQTNSFKSIKNNKFIDKFKNIETKIIPFRNDINIFQNKKEDISFNQNNNENFFIGGEDDYNKCFMFDNYIDKFANSSMYIDKNKNNYETKELIEKRKKRRYKNRTTFSEIGLEKDIINSYGDSYINDYKDIKNMHLNTNFEYKINLNNYPYQKKNSEYIADNFVGNSSSTISNSNIYIKKNIDKIKNDNKKMFIEEENQNYKIKSNIRKKEKIFPIFY